MRFIRLVILFSMIFPFLILQRPWMPQSDTCSNFGTCGNATGGSVSVYWRGMNQVVSLRIKVDGQQQIGNCPTTNYLSEQHPDLQPNGSAQFTRLPPGYYIVRVDSIGPQGQAYHGEHPLKMDCDFLRSDAK